MFANHISDTSLIFRIFQQTDRWPRRKHREKYSSLRVGKGMQVKAMVRGHLASLRHPLLNRPEIVRNVRDAHFSEWGYSLVLLGWTPVGKFLRNRMNTCSAVGARPKKMESKYREAPALLDHCSDSHGTQAQWNMGEWIKKCCHIVRSYSRACHEKGHSCLASGMCNP